MLSIKSFIKAVLFIVGIPALLAFSFDASFLPIFLFAIPLYAIKMFYGTSKLDKALISVLSFMLVMAIVWFAVGDIVKMKINQKDPFYKTTHVRRNLEVGLERASVKDPVNLESRTLLLNYRRVLDKATATKVAKLLEEGKVDEAIVRMKTAERESYKIKKNLDDPRNDWDVKTKKLWKKIFPGSQKEAILKITFPMTLLPGNKTTKKNGVVIPANRKIYFSSPEPFYVVQVNTTGEGYWDELFPAGKSSRSFQQAGTALWLKSTTPKGGYDVVVSY